MKITFLALTLLLGQVSGKFGGHDLFSSLGSLKMLWQNERETVEAMKSVISNMDDIKADLERYIKSHESVKLDQDPTIDYLGHPLNAYHLVRHTAFAWGHIRDKTMSKLNETRINLEKLVNRENVTKLPDYEDIEGAAFGVVRLHSLYQLNTTQIADNGIVETHLTQGLDIISEPSVANLQGPDLITFALMGKKNNLLNSMVDFFQVGVQRLKEEQAGLVANETLLDNYGFSYNLTEMEIDAKKAYAFHDQILDKRGSRTGTSRTHEKPLDKKLRKKKKFKKKFKLDNPIRDAETLAAGRGIGRQLDSDQMADYNMKYEVQKEMTCAGETYRTIEEDKGLHCFYGHNENPWLALGPIKMEIRNKAPYLAVLKEILYPHECDNITDFLTPWLGAPPGRMNPRAAKNDWTMMNAWPTEEHNEYLQKFTRRVEAITGLKANSAKEESDNFMCGNYGIGGHYGTHPDFDSPNNMRWTDPNEKRFNRISTVMAIFDAPRAGGYTAFPFTGATVQPEKGSAAWWFNLNSDGYPDYLTLHTACPVLFGQKWIGNKWIGYGPQYDKFKCDLTPMTRYKGTLK